MQLRKNNGITRLEFDSFQNFPLICAVFTRNGGVSEFPWATLNMGGTVGDDSANVFENRKRALHSVDLSIQNVFDVWQVHSADVVYTDVPRSERTEHQRADGILTDRPITLMMRFADCVPIFLYDPVQNACGIVHAGWQGTYKRIGRIAVQEMRKRFGSNPSDLVTAIGPSIGPDHYLIGEEVFEKICGAYGSDSKTFLHRTSDTMALDLWKANEFDLLSAGVRNIEVSGICTACQTENWYSHRAEHGKTGRFGAVIRLQE